MADDLEQQGFSTAAGIGLLGGGPLAAIGVGALGTSALFGGLAGSALHETAIREAENAGKRVALEAAKDANPARKAAVVFKNGNLKVKAGVAIAMGATALASGYALTKGFTSHAERIAEAKAAAAQSPSKD